MTSTGVVYETSALPGLNGSVPEFRVHDDSDQLFVLVGLLLSFGIFKQATNAGHKVGLATAHLAIDGEAGLVVFEDIFELFDRQGVNSIGDYRKVRVIRSGGLHFAEVFRRQGRGRRSSLIERSGIETT